MQEKEKGSSCATDHSAISLEKNKWVFKSFKSFKSFKNSKVSKVSTIQKFQKFLWKRTSGFSKVNLTMHTRVCVPNWKVGGEEVYNCTTKNMAPKDIIK